MKKIIALSAVFSPMAFAAGEPTGSFDWVTTIVADATTAIQSNTQVVAGLVLSIIAVFAVVKMFRKA